MTFNSNVIFLLLLFLKEGKYIWITIFVCKHWRNIPMLRKVGFLCIQSLWILFASKLVFDRPCSISSVFFYGYSKCIVRKKITVLFQFSRWKSRYYCVFFFIRPNALSAQTMRIVKIFIPPDFLLRLRLKTTIYSFNKRTNWIKMNSGYRCVLICKIN